MESVIIIMVFIADDQNKQNTIEILEGLYTWMKVGSGRPLQ